MITIDGVETKAAELDSAIVPFMQVAREIDVKDAPSFEMAGDVCKNLTALEKQIKAFWEEDVSSALKLHRSLVAKRDAMLEPVGEQKKSLVAGMKAWQDEQERARRAEQARAEAEARRIAEEAALAKAVALEQSGNKAAAEAVIAAPVETPSVFVPKTTPGGYGQFTRKNWGAEVFDLMALVKAVAEGKAPIQAIEANQVYLNAQARALKGVMNIPGVKAVEK